jgi:hypothetical protein
MCGRIIIIVKRGVKKNKNGGCCHGNQGAKNVKFTSNFTEFCGNVSCHIHI